MDEQKNPPIAPVILPAPHVSSKGKIIGIVIAAFVFIAAIFAVFPSLKEEGVFAIKTQYPKVYTLVNEKISIHAPIQINLPAGVSKTGIEQAITFEPKLKGKWVETQEQGTVAFKPDNALEIGKSYSVALATGEGEIRKDFQADEDPVVISVLPHAGSEASESSSITILFNRPMVPLTTLDELATNDIPVTITPATKGKFKWISTRSLQFIPETILVSSANYSVKVNPGFVSMDGLEVKSFEHRFTTRTLRLENPGGGILRYNQPLEIRFNQPVDLNKTVGKISLTNITYNKSIPFKATFGTRFVYDLETKKNKKEEDRSVISILLEKDRFDREGFWDFENSYQVSLKKAYPIGGDIVYSDLIQNNFSATGIIQSVRAKSERTEHASQELFDPQGKVSVTFYEEIDLDKSKITGKGLKKIEYGQKCKEIDKGGYNYYATCEQISDKATLIFSFDQSELVTPGESIPLNLKRIVNAEGLTLNTEALSVPLRVYPKLEIKKITPSEGARAGSITELVVCTNSPLKPQTGLAFSDAVKANGYIVLGRWSSSYLQTPNSYYSNPPCENGEYVNTIRYGLLPETEYALDLSLADVFGQSVSRKLSFKTGQAPNFYLRFHALDKIYNVTTPEKTKLTYAVENFDTVNVHICKVEPLIMVRYLSERPNNRTSGESLGCVQSKTDTIALPPKLWINNYFQIDVAKYFTDTRGQYVITFSNPRYIDSAGIQIYERTYLSVTNLALSEKKVQWTKYDVVPENTKKIVDAADTQGELYWVNYIGTLAPVVDAAVSVVNDPGISGAVPQIASSGSTDASGIAKFPLIKDVVGATVKAGADTAVVSAWADTLNRPWTNYSGNKLYMYTDRPIYRPGQEVFIKGIFRWNFDGEFKIDSDEPIVVKVSDSKGNEIYSKNATVSKYGTFSASIKLPADAPLGGYNISSLGGYSYFSVEEYVGAAFEASVKTAKDEYIAGDNVQFDVSGAYYFGAPVENGTVEYTLTAQDYYFDRYQDEYFSFGGGWYGCYDCGYGDTYLKRGQATLDSAGRARISQPLDFKELFSEGSRDKSKIVVLHATIKDAQGKSVTTQKSFIVHRGDFYLGVKTDPYFVGKGESFNLLLKTVDTAGKPVHESNVEVVINKIEWKSFKRQEVDGNYYNRTERVLTPILKKEVSTDGKGDYKNDFKLDDPGEYEISATATDDRGNDIKAQGYLYVYGEGSVSVRPTNNATLDISAEKTNLGTNDKAKIIFQSPYPYAKALITLERGRIFDYKIVDVTRNVYEHEFTIDSKFVPNVYVSVLLLSPNPEVKFGQVQLQIDRKEKELTINLTTDKASYLPGEKVNLKITTIDSLGKKVPAEVSVAVADLSVLALKGNPKKNPLVFFYDGFPLGITTASNVKNILTEAEVPTGTKGGGGADATGLAKKERGEFKDTAFWSAQVETNANGEASVSFTLPDNLTRWQIESLGITQDTKVGAEYREITAQKNVMVVPLRPRFVVPGDEFEIGAQVFNQSGVAQNLGITYESSTLGLAKGDKTVTRSIKPGDSTVVYWNVKAPLSQTEGTHSIALSAKGSEFEDTVRNVIPINSNTTYESVATANSTDSSTAREYVFIPGGVLMDRGGATIKTSATLAVFLSDALKYLVEYPYGCSEQLASKLSSIGILKKGLSIKNVGEMFDMPTVQFEGNTYTVDEVVSLGLKKITDAQTEDGGFAYYKGMQSDLYLTMHMINALTDIKAAGYSIDEQSLKSAVAYVGGELMARGIGYYGIDTYISGAYALSKAGDVVYLATLSADIRSKANKAYINDKAGSMSLGYLAILASKEGWGEPFIDSVFDSLENRVDIDSRGAYVKSNANNVSWQYYETPLKDTALFLKALLVNKRPFAETAHVMRWMLADRSADGAWGSTQNTLYAIDAFTEYISWKKETESNFSLKVNLDGTLVDTFDFNNKTVLSIYDTFLPISSFEQNKMHVLSFEKEARNSLTNTFYYDIGLKYYVPAEQIPPRDEGVTIQRNLYSLKDDKEENPLSEAKVGELVKGKITIMTGKPRHLFAVQDFIPAGFEIVNFDLSTEDRSVVTGKSTNNIYPDFTESHDDRVFLFKQELPAGEYTYEYYLRATTPGTFRYLPAVASELYFPENFGRTGGTLFRVNK